MKIVINACYGGYGVNEELAKLYNIDTDDRTDKTLIQMIESGADLNTDDYSKLKVVNIPDNATDYVIEEWDGYEAIIYVVDGKIHYL